MPSLNPHDIEDEIFLETIGIHFPIAALYAGINIDEKELEKPEINTIGTAVENTGQIS